MNLDILAAAAYGITGKNKLKFLDLKMLHRLGRATISGDRLKQSYNLTTDTIHTISQRISGLLKPIVVWTWSSRGRTGVEESALVDSSLHIYEFSYKLPKLKASDCGSSLSYKAIASNEILFESTIIYVQCKLKNFFLLEMNYIFYL